MLSVFPENYFFAVRVNNFGPYPYPIIDPLDYMYLIIWSFGICRRHTFLSGINTRNNHWHFLFSNSIFKLRPRLIFSLACKDIKSIQSVSGCRLMLTACVMVIFLDKLKTTEAHEYAWNIACREYFSFINFDDICQKRLELA